MNRPTVFLFMTNVTLTVGTWLVVTFVILMVMLDVREYLGEDGTSPFADWFAALGDAAAAKITVVLARIEQGNLSNVKGFDRGAGFRAGLPIVFGPRRRCWSFRWPAERRSGSSAISRPRRTARRPTSGVNDRRGEQWL